MRTLAVLIVSIALAAACSETSVAAQAAAFAAAIKTIRQ